MIHYQVLSDSSMEKKAQMQAGTYTVAVASRVAQYLDVGVSGSEGSSMAGRSDKCIRFASLCERGLCREPPPWEAGVTQAKADKGNTRRAVTVFVNNSTGSVCVCVKW